MFSLNFTTSKWCNLRKGATSKVNAIALGAVDRRRRRQRGPFRLLGIESLDNVPPATWRQKTREKRFFLKMNIDVKRILKGKMSKKMKRFELEWYEDFLKMKCSRNFWNSLTNGTFTDLIHIGEKAQFKSLRRYFAVLRAKKLNSLEMPSQTQSSFSRRTFNCFDESWCSQLNPSFGLRDSTYPL